MKFTLHYFVTFSVYVAIFHGDGSVVVSHSAVEMGQGINTKLIQVVAYVLGIPMETITVAPFTTVIGANRSATFLSIASESVCLAAKKACNSILERMKPVREKMPNASWPEIVQQSFLQNINLTQKEELMPQDTKPYPIVGCSCAEIELDVLTGNIQILRVDITEDVGQSVSPLIDVGQIEGIDQS